MAPRFWAGARMFSAMTRTARPITAGGRACWCSSMTRRRSSGAAVGLARLPDEFRGWPVRFGWDDVEPADHVTVTSLGRWLIEHLGVDATAGMTTLDWLLTPQQRLLGVVAGPVHADQTGAITEVRRSLSWYPTRCGVGCWPASGGASPKRRPSSRGPPRSATKPARRLPPRGWCVTVCGWRC